LTLPKGSFEGDVAVKDLRERMARAPDLPPEPPMRNDGRSGAMSRSTAKWQEWVARG
jgi:hypothetical protein